MPELTLSPRQGSMNSSTDLTFFKEKIVKILEKRLKTCQICSNVINEMILYSLLRNSLNWGLYAGLSLLFIGKKISWFFPCISTIVKRNSLYKELQPVKKRFHGIKIWMTWSAMRKAVAWPRTSGPPWGRPTVPSFTRPLSSLRTNSAPVDSKSADRAADCFEWSWLSADLAGRYLCQPKTRGPVRNVVLRLEFQKNYCATNTGSPKVELRFCPWLIFVQILN